MSLTPLLLLLTARAVYSQIPTPPTNSVVQPSPSASSYALQFSILPAQAQVCESAYVSWTTTPLLTSDEPISLTLWVRSPVTGLYQGLANDALLGNQSWYWNPVNVPEGIYVLSGQNSTPNEAKLQGSSNTFQVSAGSSTACLTAASSSASGTSTLPSSSPSSAQSSSGVSSSSTLTAVPSGVPIDDTSSSGLSTGAKAGIATAAAIVVLAALVALCGFFFCRSRVNRSRRDTVLGGAGKFNGLGSTDGHTYLSQSASTARDPFASPADGLGRSNSDRRTFADLPADPDLISEKYSPPILPPILPYVPSSPPRVAARPSRHSPSSSSSRVSVHESVEMTPTSAFSYSQFGGSPTGLVRTSSETENRRSRGPAARKPVPAYNLEDPTLKDSKISLPLNDNLEHQYNQNPSGVRNPSPTFNTGLHQLQPQQPLNHKSSFGDAHGNVHYLIPDMPPQPPASPPPAGIFGR